MPPLPTAFTGTVVYAQAHDDHGAAHVANVLPPRGPATRALPAPDSPLATDPRPLRAESVPCRGGARRGRPGQRRPGLLAAREHGSGTQFSRRLPVNRQSSARGENTANRARGGRETQRRRHHENRTRRQHLPTTARGASRNCRTHKLLHTTTLGPGRESARRHDAPWSDRRCGQG